MWDNARLLNQIANGLIAAAVLAGLIVAGLHVVRLPQFAVREVQVEGRLDHVSPEQLAAVARQAAHGTFFTLDLEGARRQFEKLPWVRKVEVRRQWPARLVLDVEEHVALARWGDSALVNDRGEVFEAATDETLPVFVGPDGLSPLQNLFLFTRSDTIYGGSNEIQRNVIAERHWKLPRDTYS